jgi:sulfite dehydrogenase (cytochrome) subunit B
MSTWKIVCAVMVAAMEMAGTTGGQSQPATAGTSKQAAKDGPNQVQRIVLPQYPGEIMQGPNVQVYERDCLICHTARYVSMQPRFSKAVWQSEVKKMVDAYGAPISEADQALIVEYLVAVKGLETPSTMAAPPK